MGNQNTCNTCCQNRGHAGDNPTNEYIVFEGKKNEFMSGVYSSEDNYTSVEQNGELEERKTTDSPFKRKFKNRK